MMLVRVVHLQRVLHFSASIMSPEKPFRSQLAVSESFRKAATIRKGANRTVFINEVIADELKSFRN